MERTLGIIGGMGPMAGADLFQKIIQVTDAQKDQEHLHVILESNPKTPDRIGAILGETQSPVPEMVRSALRLEAAGCEVIVLACHTAHYFYDQVLPFVHVPFLHMPREVTSYLADHGIQRVGLLATTATLEAGVYDKPFAESGLTMIRPKKETVDEMMRLIFEGVKAGNPNVDTSRFVQDLRDLQKEEKIECFLLACTELPLLFARPEFAEFQTVDGTLVLAKAAVLAAGGKLKAE